MRSKLQTQLNAYTERLSLIRAFGTAQSLLSWDRETHMPKGAGAERGMALSTLAGHSHSLFTEKNFVNTVNLLYEQRESLSPQWRRSVELTYREINKACKVPKVFVEETNTIINASYLSWLDAKKENNFALFEPHLAKVIENRRQYAEFLDPDKDPYDVCLDDYEEGLTGDALTAMFTQLKGGLKELLTKVLQKNTIYENPLDNLRIDPGILRSFLEDMVTTVGFDLNRGHIGSVEHPFEISISPSDIRLNTRFDQDQNSFTIMGMVHELGHGLYEQNIDPEYAQYFLDSGISLGIHESQSRFLENILGRSLEFWQFFLPRLQASVPALVKTQPIDIVNALNTVQPTLIRTEADEVTYNLHIILRFELERDLLQRKIQVKELPELWRAKTEELLQIPCPTDREGVLQDVHWAWGNLGYFPTYTLGNLNAAQLFGKFSVDHPDWCEEIKQGNFGSYVNWFKPRIWQYGSFLQPEELMLQATGEKTNPKYLLEFLEKKYLKTF